MKRINHRDIAAKLAAGDIGSLIHTDLASEVEEADIEICASGFDNLVLSNDLTELQQLRENLQKIGADRCCSVITRLLEWFDSNSEVNPIELIENEPETISSFWKDYDEASCAESPRELAVAYQTNQS